MSSAVVSTSAALGRPFLFDAEVKACHPERSVECAKRIPRVVEEPALSLPKGSLPYLGTSPDPRLVSVTPASRLAIRPAPEMATSGIPALDALTGGFPRGCLTEICGPASSGRTSVMLAALAAATLRGEYCALIDASDTLDPHSLVAANVDLDRLLWVRCSENSPQRHRDTEKTAVRAGKLGKGTALAVPYSNSSDAALAAEGRLEQVLRVTDLLLESGGFGLILLDLADMPHQSARRIPMTTWFRFRRAVEHKPTILLALAQQPIAGSCSSLLLQLGSQKFSKRTLQSQSSNTSRGAAQLISPGPKPWVVHKKSPESQRDVTLSIYPSHAHLLTELNINVELVRSRLDRKPAQSVTFETKTAWAAG